MTRLSYIQVNRMKFAYLTGISSVAVKPLRLTQLAAAGVRPITSFIIDLSDKPAREAVRDELKRRIEQQASTVGRGGANR